MFARQFLWQRIYIYNRTTSNIYEVIYSSPEVSKLQGALSLREGGALGPLGVAGFYLNEIWAQDKIYILVGTLLVWNMKSALFPDLNFTEVYTNLENDVIL
jgi:hypothetical protein